MLNDSQFRKLELGIQVFLGVMVLVFCVVAFATWEKTESLEEAALNGNCSYLFEQGYFTDNTNVSPGPDLNYSFSSEDLKDKTD